MNNAADGPGLPERDEFTADTSQDGTSKFSLDKFYTAAVDKKGRHTTVRMNVPPSLLRTIQEMVARRTIPEYRTSHDVLRDLLVVGAHMRLDQIDEPGFSRAVEAMRVQGEIQTMIAMAEQEKSVVDDFERMVRLADTPELKRMVAEKATHAMSGMTSLEQRDRLRRLMA